MTQKMKTILGMETTHAKQWRTTLVVAVVVDVVCVDPVVAVLCDVREGRVTSETWHSGLLHDASIAAHVTHREKRMWIWRWMQSH